MAIQPNLFTKSFDTTSITLSTTTHMLGTVSLVSVQDVLITTTTCIIAAQNSRTIGVVVKRLDCVIHKHM